jgi:tungstate transport system substrate-binding protein
MRTRFFLPLVALAALALSYSPTSAADRFITLSSTTSTQNSGLFEYLLPKFTAATGIDVHVVAVGTGQAIRMGEHGDADVLLVHDKPSELKFLAEGYASERRDVMYNDFVIVGPKQDPAHVAGLTDAVEAFKRIAATKSAFVSRGDDSGTNKAELRLWQEAGVNAKAASGTWYKEAGSGMGATLNTSSGLNAYTLSDRATWSNFHNRGDLAIVVQGDARLFNQYGVLPVNPKRFPHVKAEDALAFANWLTSPGGQKIIAGYQVNGEQQFFPNYKP